MGVASAQARDVGRLFDQARDSPDGFEEYAGQLGEAFADAPGVLARSAAAHVRALIGAD